MSKRLFTSWAVCAAYPRLGIAAVILLSAALVAGCAASAAGTAAAPATVQPTAGATSLATSAPVAQVKVAQNGQFGQILVDSTGRTLYLYTKDSKNTSNCTDQCATAWPPLVTSGMPTAGAGADPSLVGTTTRQDGQTQVTYNGHPLYHWSKDQKPGDATGENIGGVWFVVSSSGDKVAPAGSPASTPGTAPSSQYYP